MIPNQGKCYDDKQFFCDEGLIPKTQCAPYVYMCQGYSLCKEWYMFTVLKSSCINFRLFVKDQCNVRCKHIL